MEFYTSLIIEILTPAIGEMVEIFTFATSTLLTEQITVSTSETCSDLKQNCLLQILPCELATFSQPKSVC